ncbi:EMB1027 [Symbiodinium sp. CCMP2456]|nr:EMB1027 [Symbiodinium sp. CCMP2456]
MTHPIELEQRRRVLDVSLDGCAFGEAAVPSLARICLNVRRFSLCQCGGGEGSLGQSFAVHLEDLARGLGRRRKGSGTASAESSPAQVSRSTRERQWHPEICGDARTGYVDVLALSLAGGSIFNCMSWINEGWRLLGRARRRSTGPLVALSLALSSHLAHLSWNALPGFVAAWAPTPTVHHSGSLLPGSVRAVAAVASAVEAGPAVKTLSEASLQAQVEGFFARALADVAGGAKVMVAPADPRFGDYQCNNAMGLFKQSKKEGGKEGWKSPRDVGEAIKAALPAEASELFEEVNVAPQGFITVKLSPQWLHKQVAELFDHGLQLRSSMSQRIVIDYSSPNIAKEMHVGHLRSTILGDTMANLFEDLGHEVVRLNHVGDWGTQFGMLLEYMRREEALDGEASSMVVSDLQKFYRSAKEAFDEDDEFRKKAQTNVVELQSGADWARTAWNRICEASRKEFDTVYGRLQIRGLQERGESFYNKMLPGVVEELQEKGLVTESDGALCVFTNVSETPLIVQKADGGFGYDSTDCAAVQHRINEENANRVIYVIDNGQELHMRMVFSAAEKAGWLSGGARLDFMGFGLVQGQDGKKFKTRSGEVVRLRDLLDEAADRSEVELRKRAENANIVLDEEKEAKLKQNAESIGVAAVKYFDLRQNRNSDYRFSYDSMLDPKGNTAVYVLYAYARIAGVLRRADFEIGTLSTTDLELTEAPERALALRLLRLPEVIAQVEDDLFPSRLVDHMYGLATDFSSFYTECPVVGSEQQKSRLILCEVVRRQLAYCLGLLRIEPFEQL